MATRDHPHGHPLAPKTVRHIGAMLYTSLAEADCVGIPTIQHLMANKRVRLPKLTKRKPGVIAKGKVQGLARASATARYHAFIATATGSGCRWGELLTLQWPDLGITTGGLIVSKSLARTKSGLWPTRGRLPRGSEGVVGNKRS
ncbi:MAG: hypothetical protein HUU41_01795 [Bryobacteraceae bacterium]|nr:hypothetical protein [Bryobacteraceae bacterium]